MRLWRHRLNRLVFPQLSSTVCRGGCCGASDAEAASDGASSAFALSSLTISLSVNLVQDPVNTVIADTGSLTSNLHLVLSQKSDFHCPTRRFDSFREVCPNICRHEVFWFSPIIFDNSKNHGQRGSWDRGPRIQGGPEGALGSPTDCQRSPHYGRRKRRRRRKSACISNRGAV